MAMNRQGLALCIPRSLSCVEQRRSTVDALCTVHFRILSSSYGLIFRVSGLVRATFALV